MIIHPHGKLLRKFIYTDAGNDDGREEPAMFLYRRDVKGKSALIPLACAYKYAEPRGKEEIFTVMVECLSIASALDYPVNQQSAVTIMLTIQDGLDELIKMPAREIKKHEIGEATLTVNGERQASTAVMV
jgi:hypothetical protein